MLVAGGLPLRLHDRLLRQLARRANATKAELLAALEAELRAELPAECTARSFACVVASL